MADGCALLAQYCSVPQKLGFIDSALDASIDQRKTTKKRQMRCWNDVVTYMYQSQKKFHNII